MKNKCHKKWKLKNVSIKNNKRLFWVNELNKVLSSNDINFFSNKYTKTNIKMVTFKNVSN